MKVFVAIVDAKGKKSTFALREKPILIGRSTKAHVTISDELASSTHCSIYLKDNCVFIEDIESKNGIFLNGIRVYKQRIYLDDKVKLGSSYLYFDHDRLEAKIKKILQPVGHGNNAAREVTLELDQSQKIFEKKKPINDKLYEGVQETVAKREKGFNKKLFLLREKIAQAIDLIISFTFLITGFVGFYFFDHKTFKELYIDKSPVDAISADITLILIGVGVISAYIFFKINRGKTKSSIGEKFMGLV